MHVAARAEVAAGAGQHRDRDVVVGVGGDERFVEEPGGGAIDRVAEAMKLRGWV